MRRVSVVEGKEVAEQLSIPHIETSAVTGHNVEDVFRLLADQMLKKSRGSGSSDAPEASKGAKDAVDISSKSSSENKGGRCGC